MQVGSITLQMAADIAKLQQDMQQAANVVGNSMGQIVNSVDSAKIAFIGLSVVAGAGFFAAFVASSIQAADEIDNLSQRTGVAHEELSTLMYAANQSDLEIGSLTKGLTELNKKMADAANGGEESKKLFDDLGVSVKNASGQMKSADQIILDMAGKFEEARNGSQKVALAFDALGKAGVDFVPLFNAGADGIREMQKEAKLFGLEVSGNASRSAADFLDNLERGSSIIKGFGNQIAENLSPILLELTNDLSDSVKAFLELHGGMQGLVSSTIGQFLLEQKENFFAIAESIKILLSQAMEIASAFNAATGSTSLFSSAVEGVKFLLQGVSLTVAGIEDGFSLLTAAALKVGAGIVEGFVKPFELAAQALGKILNALSENSGNHLLILSSKIKSTYTNLGESSKKIIDDLAKQEGAVGRLQKKWQEFDKNRQMINLMGPTTNSAQTGDIKRPPKKPGEKSDIEKELEKLREKAALQSAELELNRKLSEAEKIRIQLQQKFGETFDKITPKQREELNSVLKLIEANEDLAETRKKQIEFAREYIKFFEAQFSKPIQAIQEQNEKLREEIALFGKSRKEIDDYTESKINAKIAALQLSEGTAEEIAALEKLLDVTKQNSALLSQRAGQNGLAQLQEENKKFSLKLIGDENKRKNAEIEIEAEKWREIIKQTKEGSEERQKIEEEFAVWMKNKSLEPQLQQWDNFWSSIDAAAQDTFTSIFDGGEVSFKKLGDALKKSLVDMLYQLTVKQWLIDLKVNIGQSGGIGGVGGLLSGLFGGSSGGGGGFASGDGENDNSALGGVGSLISVGQTVGSLFSATGGGGAFAAGAGGGLSGLMAGIGAVVPWVAAAIAVISMFQEEDVPQNQKITAGFGNFDAEKWSPDFMGGELVKQTQFGRFGLADQGTENPFDDKNGGQGDPFTTEKFTAFFQYFDALDSMIIESAKLTETQKNNIALVVEELGAVSSDPGSWSEVMLATAKQRYAAVFGEISEGWGQFVTDFKGKSEEFPAYVAKVLTALNVVKSDSKMDQLGLTREEVGDQLQGLEQYKKSTESLVDTFIRVSSEFEATNRTAQLFGKGVKEVFGEVGLSSLKAREQLIEFVGGIDALNSAQSFYLSNFYTEGERLQMQMDLLLPQLQALGYEAVPATREEFRAMIEALDLTSEAGRQAYADLIKLAPAIANVTDESTVKPKLPEYKPTVIDKAVISQSVSDATQTAVDATIDNTREWAEKLAVLQGEKTEREIQMQHDLEDAYDDNVRAIIKQVYALEDQKEAEENLAKISEKRATWETRLAILLGEKTQEQASLEADLAANTDEATQAIIRRVYQLEKEKLQNEEIAEIAKSRLMWQQQLDIITGKRRERDIQLENELADVKDENTRAIIRQVYALQDEKDARQRVAEASARATDLALKAVETAAKAEKERLQITKQAAEENAKNIKEVFDVLSQSVESLLVNSNSAAAKQFIYSALITARNSGYLPDKKGLTDAIKGFTVAIGKTQFKTASDAEREKLVTANRIAELRDISGQQLSAAEQQTQLINDQIKAVQDQVDAAKEMADAARGLNAPILSLSDAVKALADALERENAVKLTTQQQTTYSNKSGDFYDMTSGTSQYAGQTFTRQEMRDRIIAMANAGQLMDLYNWSVNNGFPSYMIDDILGYPSGTSNNWAKENGLPAFANGGNHYGGMRIVGENGPELEYTGPSRIYNNSELRDMFASGEKTPALLQQLIDENRSFAAALVGVEVKIHNLLRRWDVDGLPAERETMQ